MKIWKQGIQRGQGLTVRDPPRVWDNRDRFFEPIGTTRVPIVGATRPTFGYYSEFPDQLVGFVDSIRRFLLVLCRDRHVRQVNFDTGCRGSPTRELP